MTHPAMLIEKSEVFDQTLGPGAPGLGEEWMQGLQSFGEIIREVACLQGRQAVSGADALRKTNGLRTQLLSE